MSPRLLTRRTLPETLRYLAAQLRTGTHWSVVAVALDATADELESASGGPPLGGDGQEHEGTTEQTTQHKRNPSSQG